MVIINRFIPNSQIFEQGNSSIDVPSTNGESFGGILKSKLDEVNDKILESNTLTDKMIAGDEDVTIDQVMLATQEANMSLQLAVQVRNKLVEAYQEVSKIQL